MRKQRRERCSMLKKSSKIRGVSVVPVMAQEMLEYCRRISGSENSSEKLIRVAAGIDMSIEDR